MVVQATLDRAEIHRDASTFPESLCHLSVLISIEKLVLTLGSAILGGSSMRLLFIALLVSLGALLIAAAAMARHISAQRARLKREPVPAYEPSDESEPELRRSGPTTLLGLNAGRSSRGRYS